MVTNIKQLNSITPDEIRAIRKNLGLSQVEAGELIGGGPRAFTKYEAGTVTPVASTVKLLRILETNPNIINELGGNVNNLVVTEKFVLPFEVTDDHITALKEKKLTELLRKLLSAEAQTFGLPENGIHVSVGTTIPDGGEDARIIWTGGPHKTSFLPSRLCQFQLKSGKISPTAAAQEVVTKDGTIKPMVRSILEQGGNYILLCAVPYVQQQIRDRMKCIRNAILIANIEIEDSQVDFRDASQIAAWVNRYPPVAIWLKQLTQPGTIGQFRSWSHWATRTEHASSPWVEDERMEILREPIRKEVSQKHKIIRVLGVSGIGKSRLILEILSPSVEDEQCGYSISDMVLYTDESESGFYHISNIVQTLADSQQRGVVVVDRCPPDHHRLLANMIRRHQSHLSLITIDDELPSGRPAKTGVEVKDNYTLVYIAEPPSSVTNEILSQLCPVLPPEDFYRLARFSKGFPTIAHFVASAWTSSKSIVNATEKDFVETFILGRKTDDKRLLMRSTRLLAAFRLVRTEDPDDNPLIEVATFGCQVSASDLRHCFNDLVDRGVARRRGKFVTLEPLPIALKMAENQWSQWNCENWDTILGGDISTDLKVNAAKQLALLNTTEIAQSVVEYVCRCGGPFDEANSLFQSGHAEVLSALVQIDTLIVSSQIERSLNSDPNLREVQGDVRRQLIWTLEKIAFHSGSFEIGARLLLRLALAENELCANNATGTFVALFPVMSGNTTADGVRRLNLLEEFSQSCDSMQRKIVVEALVAGSDTDNFTRNVGAGTLGTRPALDPWHPANKSDEHAYIQGCVDILCKFATENDAAAIAARSSLGNNLRSLASNGFIELVERIVNSFSPEIDYWPEAVEALGHYNRHDYREINPEIKTRINSLTKQLMPQNMEARLRALVTEMSRGYLYSEKIDEKTLHCLQIDAVREFAEELSEQFDIVVSFLPQLSRLREPTDGWSPKRMTFHFGNAIAELHDSPLEWLDPITEALCVVPANQRDFDLLVGYLVGISNNHFDAVESFKQKSAQSTDLAPVLPLICWYRGIIASDIHLVLKSLHAGVLPVWRLRQWKMGSVLSEVKAQAVSPLFDALLDHSAEGFDVAIELLGMYSCRERETLEKFRPQLKKAAEKLTQWSDMLYGTESTYHFTNLMKWLLSNGRDDSDACAVALSLAQAIVSLEDKFIDKSLRSLNALLLERFPEIVWPIIGQAIISDRLCAWRLRNILGRDLSCEDRFNAAILSLSEDTLFAWCRANPDKAPAFVASVIPVLTSYDYKDQSPSLHPITVRLLDEFGNRTDVLDAIRVNINNFVVQESPTKYFALYEAPLSKLRDEHQLQRVKNWALVTLRENNRICKLTRDREEEWDAQNDI